MVDRWQRVASLMNATNVIARGGTQKQDERYHRAPRIPPPTDPPPFTPPPQHPQNYGENASYYAPQPASPFSPALGGPVQQHGAFTPSQGWNQPYPNLQEHSSTQRSDVAMYPPSNMTAQPDYSHNPYVATPPHGSPHMGYAQSHPYDNSSPPSQFSRPPPERSQTEYNYMQSPPSWPSEPSDDNQSQPIFHMSLPRSYTVPAQSYVEPHDCNAHEDP
jgi:hypothetical protein